MKDEGKISEDEMPGEKKHRHKGKSTESLLDKERIREVLKIRPGQTVLDAGCGSGYMSRVFSEEVTASGSVVALDPDTEAIEVLERQTRGTNIRTMAGDITRPTSLEASSVDLIYLSTVMHGFSREEMSGFLEEAQRLLKPGAMLAVVEIEKKETPFGPPMKIRLSPEELQEIVPLSPAGTFRPGDHLYLQLFRNREDG